MDRHFLLAVVAYLLPTFVLGFVWHMIVFKTQYERLAVYRPDVMFPLGLASMLTQGLAYAWVYPRLFSTAPDAWIGSAMRFAVVFAAIAWSFSTLAVAAKHRMSSVRSFVAIETAFTVVHFLVVSPFIALAYRGATPL
jgi:hypothetical protein